MDQRSIRVFVSSTFRDMQVIRREGLNVESALPRLAGSAARGDPTVAPSFVALA